MKAIYSAGDNTLVINSHYISWGGSLDGPITAPTKTYLCDPSCKDAGWKDGQVLTESVDYELKEMDNSLNIDESRLISIAFPIKPSIPSIEPNWYCKEVDKVGYKCEEQCPACKKAENMPDISSIGGQDELWNGLIIDIERLLYFRRNGWSKDSIELLAYAKQKYTITRKNGKS